MENLLNRITIDPQICHGKPCIRGLRYPVENMLELLASFAKTVLIGLAVVAVYKTSRRQVIASGMTVEELLEDYPDLEKEDFLACIAYASKLLHIKSIHKVA